MIRFNVIAFTHNCIGVEEIGKFHVETDQVVERMQFLQEEVGISELDVAPIAGMNAIPKPITNALGKRIPFNISPL